VGADDIRCAGLADRAHAMEPVCGRSGAHARHASGTHGWRSHSRPAEDQSPGLAPGLDLRGLLAECTNSDSTFARAHGVLRRNLSDGAALGSFVKHLMSMRLPSPSQPYRSTRCSIIA